MDTVADKLREARALVAKGWCQKEFCAVRDSRVCYCMAGALNEVVLGDADADWVPDRYFAPLLKATGSRGPMGIARFNDAKTRTQAEVLAAFDKAIELAEARQ